MIRFLRRLFRTLRPHIVPTEAVQADIDRALTERRALREKRSQAAAKGWQTRRRAA